MFWGARRLDDCRVGKPDGGDGFVGASVTWPNRCRIASASRRASLGKGFPAARSAAPSGVSCASSDDAA
jgi:hypothetical protein